MPDITYWNYRYEENDRNFQNFIRAITPLSNPPSRKVADIKENEIFSFQNNISINLQLSKSISYSYSNSGKMGYSSPIRGIKILI